MFAYINLAMYNIRMPYKDPKKQLEQSTKRYQEIRKDPEKWKEHLRKQRERLRKYRQSKTPEEKAAALEKRRAKYLEDNPGIKPKLRFASEEERTANFREYQKKYQHKYRKEKPGQTKQYLQNYLKNRTPEKIERRRNQQTESTRRNRELNPERSREYYRQAQAEWTDGIKCTNPAIWKTAETKAMELATQLGYTDIFQPDFVGFYFDFAARKDDRIVVFQVTTLRRRSIKRKHIELARYFGLDYFVIHVRPTLDIAFINQVFTDPLPTTKSVTYLAVRGTLYDL